MSKKLQQSLMVEKYVNISIRNWLLFPFCCFRRAPVKQLWLLNNSSTTLATTILQLQLVADGTPQRQHVK